MLVPLGGKARRFDPPIRVSILGSTGSIGRSALEIIRAHPGRFQVTGLAAGSNGALLKSQILEFKPRAAAMADRKAAAALASEINSSQAAGTEIMGGREAVCALAGMPDCDVVLAAIVGFSGLEPVLAALRADKRVALANKESLVAGGALAAQLIRSGQGEILPVDSEHSALFQCLEGRRPEDVAALVLTASGGPFLRTPLADLAQVTPQQALRHPNWSMGAKVTIDSATMMNKALEVIEAFWLFGFGVDMISAVVHPQSLVHSMVRFRDGSQLAQISVPDMRGPIAYALAYPGGRLPGVMPQLNLAQAGLLEFLPLDERRFPALPLAQHALRTGGSAPAVLNAANETAVQAFLGGGLAFGGIVATVGDALEQFAGRRADSYAELEALTAEVRRAVEGMVAARRRRP